MKRIISLLLCVFTLCSIIPMSAMTASATETGALTNHIKITDMDFTVKGISEPTIDMGASVFYNGTSVTVDGTTYGPGDTIPTGALAVGDSRTITIKFAPISGFYFVDEGDSSRTYAGKVSVNGSMVTAYVGKDGVLKVMFRMSAKSADVTVDEIKFEGPATPVHGDSSKVSGKFNHRALQVDSVGYYFRKPDNIQWYGYPNSTLDSSFSCDKFALMVVTSVNPIYNKSGLINKITWNGKKIDAYLPRSDGKEGWGLLFFCDIKDNIIEETFENPFTDIKASDWYYNSVLWAVQNGITSGTTATTFSPKMVCTRSQAVMFLWNAAGNPEPTTTKNPFTDVKSGAWYYKAVLWAVENGITNGTSSTTFAPDMKCSRSQIVTFLWNAQGKPTVNAENPFKDIKTKDWYYNSVMWAVANGITAGTTATTFAPNMNCDRSQIVTFICRSYSDTEFAIISQPVNYQMESSQEDATFTVRVAGGTAPYTYTWYVLKDNDEYTEVHKTAAGKYTFSYEFSDYDFELYRNISVYCVISDAHDQTLKTVYVTVISKDGSSAAAPLTIITQPKNYQMQSSQEDAAFAVSVSGTAPYNYRWYVEKDFDQYNELRTTNAVADTFKYNFSDYDFDMYRDITVYCVITDASGQSVTTKHVTVLQK